jgi:hypothetical protein
MRTKPKRKPKPAAKARYRRPRGFTKRTDPWPFIFAAAQLSGTALRAATALLRIAVVEGGRVVEWEPDVGGDMGLHLLAGYDGLRELEQDGLVSIDWGDEGDEPVVTIVGPKP